MSKEKLVEATKDNAAHPQFKVGDKVWLSSKQVKVHQASPKLGPRQLGPYEVIERVGDRDYRLKLPPVLKIHDVFHVSRLSLYKGNKVNGEIPPPPAPIIVDNEEEYEVEEILDSRFFNRKFWYYVKWKGYGKGENSWQPVADLENAQKKIDAFHRKHPNAPRRINASLFVSFPWRTREVFTDTVASNLSWEEGKYFGRSPIGDNGSKEGGIVTV